MNSISLTTIYQECFISFVCVYVAIRILLFILLYIEFHMCVLFFPIFNRRYYKTIYQLLLFYSLS